MKNNIISSSQFYFSVFLSTLVALLFIDVNTSYIEILFSAIFIVIAFFSIYFYSGENSTLFRILLNIYYVLTSVFVMNKFIYFMSKTLKSGPYWVLTLIMAVTIFFCSVKGFEALSRASVIISFFVGLFLLYILFSTVTNIKIGELNFNNTTTILPSLVLLFPVATYSSLGNRLKDTKTFPSLCYFISSFLVLGYMIFISSPIAHQTPLYYVMKNAKLGIFRGCDFLLLAIITIGVIFYISLSLQSITLKNSKLKISVYIILISTISLICLYNYEIKGIFNSEILQIILAIFMLLAVNCNSLIEKIKFLCKK